jgi:hypothetical protein
MIGQSLYKAFGEHEEDRLRQQDQMRALAEADAREAAARRSRDIAVLVGRGEKIIAERRDAPGGTSVPKVAPAPEGSVVPQSLPGVGLGGMTAPGRSSGAVGAPGVADGRPILAPGEDTGHSHWELSSSTASSRVREFVKEISESELDEPYEYFIHGTTQSNAENFQLKRGKQLFTSTDPAVAEFFATRTVGREGGELGGVVIVLPRSQAQWLRSNKLLLTRPVPDMPMFKETIFEPGALPTLERNAIVEPLPKGVFDQ